MPVCTSNIFTVISCCFYLYLANMIFYIVKPLQQWQLFHHIVMHEVNDKDYNIPVGSQVRYSGEFKFTFLEIWKICTNVYILKISSFYYHGLVLSNRLFEFSSNKMLQMKDKGGQMNNININLLQRCIYCLAPSAIFKQTLHCRVRLCKCYFPFFVLALQDQKNLNVLIVVKVNHK